MEFWEMCTRFFSMKDRYGDTVRPIMKVGSVNDKGNINIEPVKIWGNVNGESLAEQKQREGMSEKIVKFWDDFVNAESSRGLNDGVIKKVNQLLKGGTKYIDSDEEAEQINVVLSRFMQFLGKEKGDEFTMGELSQIRKLLKELKFIENPK